jgi:Zn-dependent protease
MPGPDQILFLIIFFPLFMIAVMAHEVSHGYVALRQGDPTAKYAGRLSLNPITHLDPVGTFMFILAALSNLPLFGWAKPVPINPLLFKEYRNGMIRVSLAGVAANFALIIITTIIFKVLVMAGVIRIIGFDALSIIYANPLSMYLSKILQMFMLLNMILVMFNLIPIPPLDGSKVLMMLLPPEQARAYERIAPYGFFIIIGLLMMNSFIPILTYFFMPGELLINVLINFILHG